MSNDKARLRIYDLNSKVLELVREGKRSPEGVARVLQTIQDDTGFETTLFPLSLVETGKVVLGSNLLGDASVQMESWIKFYRDRYSIKLNDVASIAIPEHQQGFDRLIVVAEGLTPNRIVESMKKPMKVWTYADDLDSAIIPAPSFSRPKGTYAIWCRNRVEADEELKNKSVEMLESDGVSCLNLEERLLFEEIFFGETGKHLDVKNVTLCAGSRDRDGCVPYVSWFSGDGGVRVSWYHLQGRDVGLRARQAIS